MGFVLHTCLSEDIHLEFLVLRELPGSVEDQSSLSLRVVEWLAAPRPPHTEAAPITASHIP